MTDIRIDKIRTLQERTLPVFTEIERLLEDLRQRAYEKFAARGFAEGHALDDWLAAEREICWPAAEFVENDGEFVLSVALAGFEPADITLTATPKELIVKATRAAERREPAKAREAQVRWSEFRGDDVYRRIDLPCAIDVEKLSATFANGLLKIIAPKAAEARPAKPVEVAVAA